MRKSYWEWSNHFLGRFFVVEYDGLGNKRKETVLIFVEHQGTDGTIGVIRYIFKVRIPELNFDKEFTSIPDHQELEQHVIKLILQETTKWMNFMTEYMSIGDIPIKRS